MEQVRRVCGFLELRLNKMATYLLQTYSSQSKSCSCCCSSCEDLGYGYVTSCNPSIGTAATDGYSFYSPGHVITCEAVSVTCPQNKDYQLSCYKQVTTPLTPPTPTTAAPSSDPTCTDCGDLTQPVRNNIAPFVFAASYNNVQACINAGIGFRYYGIGFLQGNVEMLCGGICFRCS